MCQVKFYFSNVELFLNFTINEKAGIEIGREELIAGMTKAYKYQTFSGLVGCINPEMLFRNNNSAYFG